MFFSVVIPLYNKQPSIFRAISSVLNQTHTEFELIIVDDGSTDGSADVVRSISDPRIRLFSQTNSGVSKARNVGVQQACADWVAFLDADDEYEPDFLKEAAAFIATYGTHELSMVGANYYVAVRSHIALNWPAESGIYDYFDLFRNQQSPNNSSTTVVNRGKFLEAGGFPVGVKQFEDWIAWFKLALSGNFGFISTPLGVYHYTEGSVSRSKHDPKAFFYAAVLFPENIIEYAEKYSQDSVRIKKMQNCISEFSIHIAGLLAHDGAKILALRIMKYARLSALFRSQKGSLLFLLKQLLVPQFVKRVYWEMKNVDAGL